MEPRKKQNDYLMRARKAARTKNLSLCRYWIFKAEQHAPISDIQWHNIQTITTSSFVETLRNEIWDRRKAS